MTAFEIFRGIKLSQFCHRFCDCQNKPVTSQLMAVAGLAFSVV